MLAAPGVSARGPWPQARGRLSPSGPRPSAPLPGAVSGCPGPRKGPALCKPPGNFTSIKTIHRNCDARLCYQVREAEAGGSQAGLENKHKSCGWSSGQGPGPARCPASQVSAWPVVSLPVGIRKTCLHMVGFSQEAEQSGGPESASLCCNPGSKQSVRALGSQEKSFTQGRGKDGLPARMQPSGRHKCLPGRREVVSSSPV